VRPASAANPAPSSWHAKKGIVPDIELYLVLEAYGYRSKDGDDVSLIDKRVRDALESKVLTAKSLRDAIDEIIESHRPGTPSAQAADERPSSG
jgi:hypothetical protein